MWGKAISEGITDEKFNNFRKRALDMEFSDKVTDDYAQFQMGLWM